MRRTSIALTATLVLSACGSNSTTTTTTAPAPPASDLATASSSVLLAGKLLALDASLSRDFMPTSQPDGQPLLAVLSIRTEDGSNVPATVSADALWVLAGAGGWSTSPREERSRAETAPAYEVVGRNGPKWSPGTVADVVIRLHDQTGNTALLRVANRRIERLDESDVGPQ